MDYPTTPTSEQETLQVQGIDVKMTTYSSDPNDNESYMAMFIDYPADFDMTSNPKSNLEGAMNGSVNNVKGGQLVSSNFTTVHGHPAVDFLISVPNDNLYLKSRNILVGNTLYTVGIVSLTATPPNYDKYVNSFALTQ
jgi:hypothetical protein